MLKADAVFLSPPWGGPAYQQSTTFDLDTMLPPPLSGVEVFRAARAVSPNVAFFLPRNVDMEQVARLPQASTLSSTCAASGEPPQEVAEGKMEVVEMVELEQQFLNGKHKTTTAYFGEDVIADEARASCQGVLEDDLEEAGVAGPRAKAGTDPASTGSIVPWSGHHVRFSDSDHDDADEDEDGDDGDNDGVDSRAYFPGAPDESMLMAPPRQAEVVGKSRERENELYQAWIAAIHSR